MKKIILSLFLVGAFYACSNEPSQTEVEVKQEVKKDNKKYAKKPEVTLMTGVDKMLKALKNDPIIEWEAYKPTGTHVGNLNLSEGSFTLNGDMLQAVSLEFDMNSISCTDITSEKYNAKLINHLRSDDFFSVEKYPTATFVSKSVEKDGDHFNVTGDLTIKDNTSSITVPVYLKKTAEKDIFYGAVEVDRTKFDIRYKSKSFFPELGDKFISDNFKIRFAVPQFK